MDSKGDRVGHSIVSNNEKISPQGTFRLIWILVYFIVQGITPCTVTATGVAVTSLAVLVSVWLLVIVWVPCNL